MVRGEVFFMAVFTIHCAGRIQGCQESCKCYSFSAKVFLRRAECTQEPTGEWAKNIKFLKMRTNMHQLTTNTLQEAWTLREADLQFCNITNIKTKALANVSSLTVLRLSHNLIESIDTNAFSKLKNLHQLYVDNNKLVTWKANIHVSLKYLQVLFLQINNLTKIPQLPPSIQSLDVSYNNITSLNTELMERILHLDVCMNPINNVTSNSTLKNIKYFCMSGNLDNISTNFSTHFINVENFTFLSYPNTTTLSKLMQDRIMSLPNVVTLYIGNTNLYNLSFLQHMSKLKTLTLQEVNIEDYGNIDKILSGLGNVTTLDFERSPTLVKAIVINFHILLNLRRLERLSLKNSNIVHIPCELCQMQKNLKIDFQDNPLECDCRIAEIENSLSQYLQDYILLPQDIKCQSPQQFFGLTINEFRRYNTCSESNVCFKENHTCNQNKNFDPMKSNKITSGKYEVNSSIYYIILGVVTGVLGIAVIGLFIMYIILKKERQIEPQPGIQSRTFQQLQKLASEDSLIN